MRRPYRERLRIILDELGAGVGGRADDLNETIRRAQPGAARDRQGARRSSARQNQVLKNLTQQRRRRDRRPRRQQEGRRALRQGDRGRRRPPPPSAARDIAAGLQRLPTFLRELRPTMAELGATADASDARRCATSTRRPASSRRFLDDLGPFAESSRLNVRTLAKTADKARPAIASAKPTVAELTKTTEHAPELANNLAIVLKDLDDRNRAVEKDKRSPGGQGYTGFEAVLQYIFDQMQAHQHLRRERLHPQGQPLRLGVQRLPERRLASSARRSRSRASTAAASPGLGPNQPGVTTADPIRHRRRRRRRAEPALRPRRRRASPRRTRPRPRARTRPASRTSRRRSRSCSRAAAAGTSRPCRAAERERPERPAPERPGGPAGAHATAQAARPQPPITRPSSTTCSAP